MNNYYFYCCCCCGCRHNWMHGIGIYLIDFCFFLVRASREFRSQFVYLYSFSWKSINGKTISVVRLVAPFLMGQMQFCIAIRHFYFVCNYGIPQVELLQCIFNFVFRCIFTWLAFQAHMIVCWIAAQLNGVLKKRKRKPHLNDSFVGFRCLRYFGHVWGLDV